MKTQELKIVPPEGYEVDWDNSSMNTIRFKPIKKKVTYADIIKELCSGNCYYINNNPTSWRQLQQLLALNKLMNVAKYLNGDWKPDFTNTNFHKFYISYDSDKKKLTIWFKQYMNDGSVYFKSEELALRAIEILGEEEVKKALGIFE